MSMHYNPLLFQASSILQEECNAKASQIAPTSFYFLFTSFPIEGTKAGRVVEESFRRQVTEEPDKENCRIIKTNEVYHNVFSHH